MPTLTTEKKKMLLEIEKQKLIIEIDLKNKEIVDEDILSLVNVKKGYGLSKGKSYKENLLKCIYNSPFLLCDQQYVGINVKKLLPIFLYVRFTAEIEELSYYYECGYYSKEEYEHQKDLIEFMFYKSSKDGKNILKTGHAENVVDNIVRCK